METLTYKVIKTDIQYNLYCDKLESLLETKRKSKSIQDEIELITLLIEKYEEQHDSFDDADPIEILKSLMKDHKMKSTDLSKLLGVSEGLVSDMINYKKGLSKEVIRKLSNNFKISQETFNRPYKLKVAANVHLRNASVMNTQKELVKVTT